MDPKRPRSRQSAEIIAGNDDLLTEIILLRLPARSLLRFKSVSKHWQSLISAPPFAVAHINHSSRRKTLPNFILGRTATATKSPEYFYFNPTTKVLLPHTFEHPFTKILQSSHGLLLLECRNWRLGPVSYRVYNPTTRKSRELEFKGTYDWRSISLFYDPAKSPHYKIIRTKRTYPAYNLWIEIYHPQLIDPRLEEDIFAREYSTTSTEMTFCDGISCNNGIYWIRFHRSSSSYYFNIESRDFEKLSGIKPLRRKLGNKSPNKNNLMESNGHVHCVSTYFDLDFKYVIVYELDHNRGWVEKYRADLNPFSELKGRPVGLLGIVRGEKEEDSSVLLHVPGMIVCYWFLGERFEVLCNFTSSKMYKEDELQFRTNSCFQFVDSLAPVN